ncbi:MAG: hypothetical protein JWP30_61 [Homoserinimonas sp.]|nr:hypothetical protein [Homoserinimonas sp.]
MRTRAVASVAIAALVLLGTSACNFMAPQATTDIYTASDGANATVGDVKVLNAMLITDNGSEANLVASVLNSSAERVRVTLQYEAGSEKIDETITVGPGHTESLGSRDGTELTLTDIDAEIGGLFPIFVQYGDTTGKQVLVPVLDGTLAEYEDLTP